MADVDIKKFYRLSWEEFHKDTTELAQRLRKLGRSWKGLLSVARGGLVPAAILGEELNLRCVEAVSMISYGADDNHPEIHDEVKIIKPLWQEVGTGAGWLVIDDLVDTGRSVEVLRKLLPDAFFATVYAKPKGRPSADLFVREFKQDTWLFFPWAIVDGDKDL